MVLFRLASAFAAASMLAMAAADSNAPTVTVKNPITTPTVTLAASKIVDIGCFQTGIPLENHGPYLYRSPGNCQLVCLEQGKNVMGLSDGENCWCGDKIPAKEWATDNKTCDTTCAGDKTVLCGGPSVLWIALTGNTRNRVDYYSPDASSSSAPSSTAPSTAKTTSTGTPSQVPQNDGKPNTIAIAVGVVVGIIGIAALVFGVWFFLRRRRQRQAEEDYRRNAANVNAFVNGGKLHTSNSSMNDSRLDPSFMDRRQSNGSIADNEDYSRRILKVTNA